MGAEAPPAGPLAAAGGGLPTRCFPLLLALAGLLAAGCAGSGASGPNAGAPLAAEGPWRIPAEELGSQRLYRVSYEGPEGELSFRLTLYLEAPEVYAMSATDTLGRKLWGLSVDAENRALWLDHREKLFCSVAGASTLEIVPLAGFPLTSLPRLLLGLLPIEPVSAPADDGTHLSFQDAEGRHWSAGREQGRLAWWSLSPAGEPTVWWRSRGAGGIFSDRRGQQQLSWRQVAREALPAPLAPAEVPEGYGEGMCAEAAVGAAASDPAGASLPAGAFDRPLQ